MTGRRGYEKSKAPLTWNDKTPHWRRPMKPTVALSMVTGDFCMLRTDAIKKVWAYVKDNNLIDPKNKKRIIVDEILEWIFPGKESISMFEITKAVNNNLKPLVREPKK